MPNYIAEKRCFRAWKARELRCWHGEIARRRPTGAGPNRLGYLCRMSSGARTVFSGRTVSCQETGTEVGG